MEKTRTKDTQTDLRGKEVPKQLLQWHPASEGKKKISIEKDRRGDLLCYRRLSPDPDHFAEPPFRGRESMAEKPDGSSGRRRAGGTACEGVPKTQKQYAVSGDDGYHNKGKQRTV